MVTLHKIPCSYCGKIVERYIYCSGACKVHGHREKKAGGLAAHVIVEPVRSGVPLGKSDIGAEPITSQEQPEFSDSKKPGYHFVAYMGKYIKDA